MSVGSHTVTLTATDSQGATATAMVHIGVTGGTIGLPTSLNVPFTQTASVPIQLQTPAPIGGVTVTLTSSNPSTVGVLTPTVTIPAGQSAANGTVSGVSPGPATLDATAPGYLPGTGGATTTADLNILETAVSFAGGASQGTVTIRLESGGSAVAAPSGGIDVTVSATDGACVAATSPVTIPAGQATATSTLSSGGTAALPCNTDVTVSASFVTSDQVPVTVNAPTITVADGSVGAGLQIEPSIQLGASGHGGVDVEITSSDPTVLLVAPDRTTPGAASATLHFPDGLVSRHACSVVI